MKSYFSDELLQKTIQELIDTANQKVVANKSVQFAMNDEVRLLLEKELKRNMQDFFFQIDAYAIRHIFKEHGNDKKKNQEGK
jgi:hypothetical protein